MLPEVPGVESSRKQRCRWWELHGTSLPANNGSRKVREKESQKIWREKLDQDLFSSGKDVQRDPFPLAAGMGHSGMCLSLSLSLGNSIWSISHSSEPSSSEVPAGDKELWPGQQLVPGPYFPESSPAFLPPTVSKGPVAQGQEAAWE